MLTTDKDLRSLTLVGAAASGAPVLKKLNGRDHLVVPVVALMEGVIHAVNSDEPEFVPASRLAAAASSWNGRPLVVKHPVRNGIQVSANDPDIVAAQGFGTIYNSKMSGSKLGMEAWIDPERLEALGEHMLLADVRAGKPIEVSVGAHVRTLTSTGQWNGKTYKRSWDDILGDHLAFLPGGRGACSIDMGCGACRAAQAYEVTDTELRALWSPDQPRDDKGRFAPGEGGTSSADAAESARGTLQLLDTAALVEIANGRIDLNQKAAHEMASRGLDRQGKWIGFPAAQKLFGHDPDDLRKDGNPDPAKEKVRGVLQIMDVEALKSVIRGEIDLTQVGRREIADRGLDKSGKWVGFEKAKKLHALESKMSFRKRISEFFRGAGFRGFAAKSDQSYENKISVAQEAVQKKYGNSGYSLMPSNAWVSSTHDDHLIVSKESRLFSVPIKWVDGQVEFTGEPSEVKMAYVAAEDFDTLRAAGAKYEDCEACGGSGEKDGNPCEACEGNGEIEVKKQQRSACESSTGAEKPCKCGGHSAQGEEEMKNKTERIAALMASEHNLVKDQKALEAITDEKVFTALEAHVEAQVKLKAAADATAAEKKRADDAEIALKAAQAAQIPAEELTELRALAAERKAKDDAEKVELVGKLKAAGAFTEEELTAKSVSELRKLATLAKVETPDFSGRGLPRAASGNKTEDFTPPNPYEAGIKALQGQRVQ